MASAKIFMHGRSQAVRLPKEFRLPGKEVRVSDPRVRDRFEAQLAIDTPIVLAAICLFEMRYGYAKSDRRASSEIQLERLLSRGIAIAPFGAADAAPRGHTRRAGSQGNANWRVRLSDRRSGAESRRDARYRQYPRI